MTAAVSSVRAATRGNTNASQFNVIPGSGIVPAVSAVLSILLFLSFLLQSCYVGPYPPVPPAGPFDAAWQNALGAAQDAGIRITRVDESAGIIRGRRGQTDVTIYIETGPDGRVRTKASFQGPSQEANIGREFNQAYRRRMGRGQGY